MGLTCAVLGAYVVQRRMAFIGDAMAHTTLPGLVIAHLSAGVCPLGHWLAAVLAAVGIGWISRRQTVKEDTAIGVVFTGMFALGIFLMSRARSFRDLSHMLFGNILGVGWGDLQLMAGVTGVVLLTLFLFHKELELTSFDATHAEVIGIRADRLKYLLLVLLALAVVTGIQAVGVILTSALLVTPAAAASLLTRPFSPDHADRGGDFRRFISHRPLCFVLPASVVRSSHRADLHGSIRGYLGQSRDEAKVLPSAAEKDAGGQGLPGGEQE